MPCTTIFSHSFNFFTFHGTQHSVWHHGTQPSRPVLITKNTNPEIPEYFKRLFAHKSIEHTFRESHGDLSRGLGILSKYAANGDAPWITAQLSNGNDCMDQLMQYLTENAYSEVQSRTYSLPFPFGLYLQCGNAHRICSSSCLSATTWV